MIVALVLRMKSPLLLLYTNEYIPNLNWVVKWISTILLKFLLIMLSRHCWAIQGHAPEEPTARMAV